LRRDGGAHHARRSGADDNGVEGGLIHAHIMREACLRRWQRLFHGHKRH
jgi:hypothetical protein